MQITLSALRSMVDQQVMVQMKGGWITVRAERGAPVPLVMTAEDGNKQMVIVPFICGSIVAHDNDLFLRYVDSTSSKTIEILLKTDEIVSVSRVVEERIVRPG